MEHTICDQFIDINLLITQLTLFETFENVCREGQST